MLQLILNREQAASLEAASGIVELHDANEMIVGYTARAYATEPLGERRFLILDDGQATFLRAAAEDVELCDRNGKVFGKVRAGVALDDQEGVIKALRNAASKGRRYTTAEVLAHLDSLAER